MSDTVDLLQREMQQEQGKKIVEHPLKKGLWTPDGVHRDGQVTAGEVDKEQEEFLKKTTMVD